VQNTNIEQLCVLGLGLAQPMALIVLSEQAQSKSKQQVSLELTNTLHKVNKSLKSHETLNGLIVVKEEWLPENGLMTPTLKVKRNEVAQHYNAIVQEYADAKSVVWE
jgi:long-chain acyl-CoA synthetase